MREERNAFTYSHTDYWDFMRFVLFVRAHLAASPLGGFPISKIKWHTMRQWACAGSGNIDYTENEAQRCNISYLRFIAKC